MDINQIAKKKAHTGAEYSSYDYEKGFLAMHSAAKVLEDALKKIENQTVSFPHLEAKQTLEEYHKQLNS